MKKIFFFLFLCVCLVVAVMSYGLSNLIPKVEPVKLVNAVYEIGYNNITLERACDLEIKIEELFKDACYITVEIEDAQRKEVKLKIEKDFLEK